MTVFRVPHVSHIHTFALVHTALAVVLFPPLSFSRGLRSAPVGWGSADDMGHTHRHPWMDVDDFAKIRSS